MCPGLRSATAAAMAPASRTDQPSSYLLELAAADDLPAFRRAVQEDNLSLVAASAWYGPSPRSKNLALRLRTPAMVAALYGSTSVLSYVLSIAPSEAARASATDGATPLQLAAAGRALSAPAAARILLAAGASPSSSSTLPLDHHHHSPTNTKQQQQQPGSPERKKKDYSSSAAAAAAPAEDINAGVFGTDEFRMYSFKVNPCSRAYTHDWTECPFAHPGENARRRDPPPRRRAAFSSRRRAASAHLRRCSPAPPPAAAPSPRRPARLPPPRRLRPPAPLQPPDICAAHSSARPPSAVARHIF